MLRVEGKNNSVLNQLFYFRELRKEQRRRYYERIKQMERDLDTNDDDDHEDSRNKKVIQEIGLEETLERPQETEQIPKSLVEKKNE